MKAFITGNAGFIAGKMEARLRQLGYEVEGCDVKTGLDCRDYFKQSSEVFDLVVHCAAIVEGREAIDGEPLRVGTNLSIDSEFFNWAVRTGQKKLICFSSAAAYPLEVQNALRDIVSEEDMVNLKTFFEADQTYGFAKYALEFLADATRKACPDMEVYVFRPFSCYGEDQSPDYPFPSFINRAKAKEDPFECWGDGEQVRDWIHHEDLVNAIFAAMDKKVYGPVNLATGIGYSMNAVIGMIMKAAGYEAPINHLLEKPVGVRYRVGGIKQMQQFYTPTITLEEGIRRCFQK